MSEVFRDAAGTVLVQFHLPARHPIPAGIRVYAAERPAARYARIQKDRPAMKTLLERNGATLSTLWDTLRSQGFIPLDSYAQLRERRATEFKPAKPYQLLTFVFRDDGTKSRDLKPQFRLFSQLRYEYVSVFEGEGADGAPLISILAKSIAQMPVRPTVVPDHEAAPYGMSVIKALPKTAARLQAA